MGLASAMAEATLAARNCLANPDFVLAENALAAAILEPFGLRSLVPCVAALPPELPIPPGSPLMIAAMLPVADRSPCLPITPSGLAEQKIDHPAPPRMRGW
jgi:hypothetical protein